MVSVVQPKAAYNTNLLSCKRRQEVLHGQDVVRNLRGGVKRRADDFVRFDGLLLVKREADCANQ